MEPSGALGYDASTKFAYMCVSVGVCFLSWSYRWFCNNYNSWGAVLSQPAHDGCSFFFESMA